MRSVFALAASILAAGGPAALAGGCGPEPLPQYMQDLPRTEEDAARVIQEIKRELGDETQVELVDDYFFVASNDTPRSFRVCKGTVARVFRYLYQDYFTRKPAKPIRVYLFRDRATYEEYCRTAYQKPPSTPFGFYMSRERKMVMNIATGTGTLAHELVHPLLAEDFPEVPSWFNEGFASLYEQSGERDGRMVGYVNWRLPGLHKALRAGKGVPLADLVKTTTDQFYGDERGVNYGTARYLCLWLQEQGRLIPFYKEFKASAKEDPTGGTALEKVAGKKLDELDKAWREWVLGLRYND
jgi:hypothetical protein